MVNTTVKPLARLRCAISAASFTGSVVTGIATSWMLTSSAERDTLVSEQTANARRSSWVCAVHSRSLREQGDRRHREQDAGVAAVLQCCTFSDLQSRESLTGTAGHDQLAAVAPLLEAGEDIVDSAC